MVRTLWHNRSVTIERPIASSFGSVQCAQTQGNAVLDAILVGRFDESVNFVFGTAIVEQCWVKGDTCNRFQNYFTEPVEDDGYIFVSEHGNHIFETL